MDDSKLRVAFVIPSGVGVGYTGPGVFLKRLIEGSKDAVIPLIYSGLRAGHYHDEDFMPRRWMKFTNASAIEQFKWSVTLCLWLLKDRKLFDVVHFHGTFFYSLIGALACLLMKKPYVLVPLAANADISENGRISGNRIVKPVRRFIVSKASHGFALGDSVAHEIEMAGLDREKITTIYNPVSEDFFGQASPDRFEKKNLVFIGMVGNLKGALSVLDAVSVLRNRGLQVSCTFYGPFEEASFEKQFDAKIRGKNLGDVVEHVKFSNDIAHVLLNSATLFLLPSRQEGIPGSFVESMSAGVPCVVTDVGSMGQIVRLSKSGKLVDRNVDSIVDACEELLENSEVWKNESSTARSFAARNFRSSAIGSIYVEKVTAFI